MNGLQKPAIILCSISYTVRIQHYAVTLAKHISVLQVKSLELTPRHQLFLNFTRELAILCRNKLPTPGKTQSYP